MVIQASALLPSTSLHWFWSFLITPESKVHSLQDNKSYDLWHHHLGHCSKNVLQHANAKLKGIPSLTPPNISSPCQGCQLDKAHEWKFPASSKQAANVLDLIHTDLCEMLTLLHSHNKWIITFIDDASGFAALHCLQSKAEDLQQGGDPNQDQKLTNEEDLGDLYSVKFFNCILASTAPASDIPKQYKDVAKLSADKQYQWRTAMQEEMDSLQDRKVWDLVDLPPDQIPVKGRWVYVVKSNG